MTCPSCLPGIVARSEVWNDQFWFHLGAGLLPFFVVLAVCLRIERVGR